MRRLLEELFSKYYKDVYSYLYIVIRRIPRYAIVDISGCYIYAKNKSFSVAGGMCFIGNLPLMLAFYEHSAVRIRGGCGFFYRSAAMVQSFR